MRVNLLGVEFDALTLNDFCNAIADSIPLGKRRVIAHHNLHSIYLFHNDLGMRDFFSKAYKIQIDGMPIVYMARLFGYPIHREHRLTYLDIIWPLITECARCGWRVYYLGGRPGVAEAAAQRLRSAYPELLLETHHGFFKKSGQENAQVLKEIKDYRPNILMVGMGMPLQEHWVSDNLLQIEADILLTSGACFDYIAGVIPSPPRWVGRIGLEWLYRLASEPKRLWKRYLIEPWFIAVLLVKELFAQRWRK